MSFSSNKSISFGVAAISFAVLMMELSMIRIMEVILAPNTGYMALTSAMFALGLGGIYLFLFPFNADKVRHYLGRLSVLFAFFAPLVIGVFNLLPFGFEINEQNLLVQIFCWAGMYIALVLPFFTAGLALSLVFKTYSHDIDRLYFYDLIAAGCACLLFIPLLPSYGPGGMIFIASAASLIAYVCFSESAKPLKAVAIVISLLMIVVPFVKQDYIEFDGHANKRGNDQMIEQGRRLMVKWDPVSKIEVFNAQKDALLFSIDGGTQGSWLKRFSGDISEFDHYKVTDPEGYFFGRNSIIHYFAESQNLAAEVLVIGAAAGGEVKAALAFGAEHVDAVELIGEMMEAERGQFSEFGGGIYNHPQVTAVVGEGRSFLRATDKKYDIIQMFSNHSSSSITQGSTAAGVAYLQTIEAYLEYFTHLTENGMMQINHHIYPRMMTTAAQAWQQLGRENFHQHVLVLESISATVDTLPTLLFKMQPWTQQEIDTVMAYANRKKAYQPYRPWPSKPSRLIYADQTYTTEREYQGEVLEYLDIRFGTYQQASLAYDIHLSIAKANGKIIYQGSEKGANIADNATIRFNLGHITDVQGETLTIEVSAPDAVKDNAFSLWLSKSKEVDLILLPGKKVGTFSIAYHPVKPSENIIANDFLKAPFPYDKAEQVPWNIEPVTDYSPFFSMIRKNLDVQKVGKDTVLDANTAYLLNTQIKEGYPKDWMHLIVVAVVSVVFSMIFIILPILRTRAQNLIWSGMSKDVTYFACLGAGFIMIQVVFIQIFHKLIGFPVHTFILVISTMLLFAGLGSMLSKRVLQLTGHRPQIVFALIVIYGIGFILSFEWLFYYFLAYPLSIRLLAGGIMIAPLAFFLGMPFPFGILGLSKNNPNAIPWAWALNGFFTVLGGYLAIVFSIFTNFIVVLAFAFVIYLLAMFVVRKNIPSYES